MSKRKGTPEWEFYDTLARLVHNRGELDATLSEDDWAVYLMDKGAIKNEAQAEYLEKVRQVAVEQIGVKMAQKENGQTVYRDTKTGRFISHQAVDDKINTYREAQAKNRIARRNET